MAKMKNRSYLGIITLLLLLVSPLAHSRPITDGIHDSDESKPSNFLEWGLSGATETCEPTYGFLPCSSNAWGLLFLIVVYEFVLSLGGRYVGIGSELFFKITGPTIFGSSLFQFLGTIPQTVILLVSALSGSVEAAQQRATLGLGLVTGTTVMILTLIWGASVILGSYDLPGAITTDQSGRDKTTPGGQGVVTDAETSYTARIMLISLIPFLILLLAKVFNSSSGKRVIFLIALVVTIILLLAYMFYQVFQPWVQNRRFEFLMNKYAKDKLLMLLSRNGQPDTRKIQALFDRIDKNKNGSVSASELRVLLLGVRIDDDDLSTDRDVENVLKSFDTSGDGNITQDEFIQGMTELVSNLSDQNPDHIKKTRRSNSQNNNQLRQALLAKSNSARMRVINSWLNYFKAFSYVIIGTVILCVFGEPMIKSVVAFAQATNLSSFWVSYLAIPLAMNYGVAIQSITSARQKTQKSISLTLSALYGGVYMNIIMGLMVFLVPVYVRNLSANVFGEVLVVLIICIAMTLLMSFRTTFARWMGYIMLLLYPISLALVYFVTSVLG